MSSLAPKQRNNTIAVLDIGSAKVVCLVAKLNKDGSFNIVSMGHHASRGVRAGVITDICALETCITQAIESAEVGAGERIRKLYVNISTNVVMSHVVFSEIKMLRREINHKDINRLNIDILAAHQQRDVDVLHTFPCDYSLDGNRGITAPIGMYCDSIGCHVNVISAPTNVLLNLTTCISRAGFGLCGYVVSVYASALACLHACDEINLGVTLIEFGASTTSFVTFENGQIIYMDCIPFGGINITNDIARGLCLGFVEAEKIKNLYGAAILTDIDAADVIEVECDFNNNVNVDVATDDQLYKQRDKDDAHYSIGVIKKSLLVKIIRARVDEILELIVDKFRSKQIMSHNKIVITGGGARLSGVRELVGRVFDAKVRIGYPNCSNFIEDYNSLEFVTAVGMMVYASSHMIGANVCDRIGNGSFERMKKKKNEAINCDDDGDYCDGGTFSKLWRWIKSYIRD